MALIFFLIGLGLDFSSITKIFKTRPNREKKNQLKLMLRTYRSILIGCLKSPDNLEPINFSIIYIWMCKMSPRLQLVTVKLIPSPLNHLTLIKNCKGKTYYVHTKINIDININITSTEIQHNMVKRKTPA